MDIKQRGISLAGQTSADQSGPRYFHLLHITFFQYLLIHDLALLGPDHVQLTLVLNWDAELGH